LAVEGRATRAPARLVDAVRSTTAGGWLVLAGMMLLAFVVRTWLNDRVDAPWIMGDEIIYSEMAKSFADGAGFLVRGEPSSINTLYPALVAPAWLAESIESTFEWAKAINTILMTLAAVPVYLWARRLVTTEWALVAAGLLLLMPSFAYTGTIMTENAFLVVFLVAAFLIARALETPTVLWQFAAVVVAAASVTIRLQGLILLVVLVTAIVLDALLTPRAASTRLRAFGHRLRAFWPTGAALLALAAAYLVYAVATSGSAVTAGLGTYDTVTEAEYSLWGGLRWTAFHLAELCLSVGLIPAFALVALAGEWIRRGARPAERAFLCATVAAVLWIVPQAGFFASRFSGRIEERNMFYLAPLLLLALVVWVGRGAPRPARLAAVAVAVPLALLATIPFERLFTVALLSDTFGLIPLMRLSTLVDGGTDTVRVAVAFGGIAAALLFLLLPRRYAALNVGAVALFLALSSWSVAGALRDQAHATRLESGAADVEWIDRAVGPDADVPFVFTSGMQPNPHILWQNEFWNRSVGDVYGLDAADPTGLPTVATKIDERGRFVDVDTGRPLTPEYVVAQPGLEIRGEEVARSDRMVLYRTPAPLGIEGRMEGVYPDGWTGANATYTNYAARPGVVRVDAGRAGWGGPDVPGTVAVDVKRLADGRRVARETFVVHSGEKRTLRLPTPAEPYRVDVSVDPTFSPSQFGLGDQRQLGVQVAFTPEPAGT
jgi:hypothetical protein